MAGNIGKGLKIYTYARTLKSKSDYATKMNRLSNQIFGEVRRPTTNDGMRVVKRLSQEPFEKRERWNTYYPAIEETQELMFHLREYGLFRDEYEDFKDEMERLRQLRRKSRIRSGWKDGVKPIKTINLRYDD